MAPAGDRYLEIIGPVNQVIAMFNRASDDNAKGKAIQALAVVLGLVAEEIEGASWPDEAEAAVERLLTATGAAGSAADTLIAELTDEAASVFAEDVAALTTASSEMRAVLGLPTQA